jgi:hypothetical protein
MTNLVRLPESRRSSRQIFFNRYELGQLLARYSSRVARGEWRDYAIDHQPGQAIFSIFRSSFERPVYALVKHVQARDVTYTLLERGRKLRQSTSLAEALAPIDRRLELISG